MLIQTCMHNFLDKVKIRMGAVRAHTWKEFVEQAEIAEKSAKKFDSPALKTKWGARTNKRRDAAQSSQSRGKDTLAVEVYKDAQLTLKKGNSNRALTLECKFLPRQYSFKVSKW